MPAYIWDKKASNKERWLIYGIPGAGKTTVSKYLKGKTYLLSLDDSFHRVDFFKDSKDIWNIDSKKPIEDMNDFVKGFDDSQYDNLVVDNISSLQKLWFVERADESGNGLDNKIQHYGEFNTWMIRLFSKLFSYDLNILITAWEKKDKSTSDTGQEFMQYQPDLRNNALDYIMGNCDIVGRLTQNPKTGKRGLFLQGNDLMYAKNRFDNRMNCKVEDLFKYEKSK